MSIPYYTNEPLQLPEEIVKDGVANLTIIGGNHREIWTMIVRSDDLPESPERCFGELETDPAPGQPDVAVEAAGSWLDEHCQRLGFKIIRFQNLNEAQREQEPDIHQYFAYCSATVRSIR